MRDNPRLFSICKPWRGVNLCKTGPWLHPQLTPHSASICASLFSLFHILTIQAEVLVGQFTRTSSCWWNMYHAKMIKTAGKLPGKKRSDSQFFPGRGDQRWNNSEQCPIHLKTWYAWDTMPYILYNPILRATLVDFCWEKLRTLFSKICQLTIYLIHELHLVQRELRFPLLYHKISISRSPQYFPTVTPPCEK